MPENLPGIHHVTAITGDVQKNVDFYVTVLGLRFVKRSINQDVPNTYHLYFGDYVGSPGTAMTFFGWPAWPQRRTGSGQVTVVSFAVPATALDFWAARLRDMAIETERSSRFGEGVITLRDPDGIELELVGSASRLRVEPWAAGPVPLDHAIHGFHSVTMTVADAGLTADFLVGTMGFRPLAGDGLWSRFETGAGGASSIVDVRSSPAGPAGEESIGTVHHVAFAVTGDTHMLDWRQTLVAAGREVTPVIERFYFRSIYYRVPGGVLFELATPSPGFTVDEAPEALGSGLSVPPWFQGRLEELHRGLPPIVVPAPTAGGVGE